MVMSLLRRRSSSFLKSSTPQSENDAPLLPQSSSIAPAAASELIYAKRLPWVRARSKRTSLAHQRNDSEDPNNSPRHRNRNHQHRSHNVTSSDLIRSTTTFCYAEVSLSRMYTQQVLARSTQRTRTPSLSHSVESSSSRASPDLPSGTDNFSYPFAHGGAKPVTSSGSPTKNMSRDKAPAAAQPASVLQTKYIIAFVRLCFCVDLTEVDFTQALRALDLLKELDDRRKREFCAALRRLNIDTAIWDYEKQELQKKSPEVYDWVLGVEDRSRRIEALYTQVYIGCRRWILINEMRLQPFHRTNCESMLDTLYPTVYSSTPTPQLTETILNSQRSAFLRYIQEVQHSGRGVLQTLENQARRPGDSNGWQVVREIVDKYITQSRKLLDDCTAIKGPEDFAPIFLSSHLRTDSGVSLMNAASNVQGTLDPNWRPQRPDSQQQTTPGKSPGRARSSSRTSSRPPVARAQTSSPTLTGASPSSTNLTLTPISGLGGIGLGLTGNSQNSSDENSKLRLAYADRKGSAIGRWARRFKNRSADDTTDDESSSGWGPVSKKGRRSLSSSRASSAMGRGESADGTRRSLTPSQGARSSSAAGNREESLERGMLAMGLSVAIDDEQRERLISEAKRAREERERERVGKLVKGRGVSPTHFKLEDERKGKIEGWNGLGGGMEARGDDCAIEDDDEIVEEKKSKKKNSGSGSGRTNSNGGVTIPFEAPATARPSPKERKMSATKQHQLQHKPSLPVVDTIEMAKSRQREERKKEKERRERESEEMDRDWRIARGREARASRYHAHNSHQTATETLFIAELP